MTKSENLKDSESYNILERKIKEFKKLVGIHEKLLYEIGRL